MFSRVEVLAFQVSCDDRLSRRLRDVPGSFGGVLLTDKEEKRCEACDHLFLTGLQLRFITHQGEDHHRSGEYDNGSEEILQE